MKTFGQLQNEVARNLSATNSTYKDTQVRDFLNAAYQDIWERAEWPSLMSTATVTVAANANTFVLGKKQYVAVRVYQGSTYNLIQRSLSDHMDETFDASTGTTGDDVTHLGDVGVLVDLSSSQIPKVKSSSASDTTQVVFLKGTTSTGAVVGETVTLSGTSPVAFANTYTSIESVSKGANTVGVITLTDNAGTTTLATIDPQETSPRYGKYRLGTTPATSTDYTVVQRRRFLPFLHTYDTPFMEMDEALRLGAEWRGWREARQFDVANLTRAMFVEELDRLVSREIVNDGSIEVWSPIYRA